MKRNLIFLNLLILITMGSAFAQNNESEARRYLQRGMAAVEMAKTPDDLLEAAKEFRSAIELAPNSTPAWYNLGAVLEKAGDIPGAIAAFKRYLELAPKAEDATQLSDKLIRLEYRQERALKLQSLEGKWTTGAIPFRLTMQANKFNLQSEGPVIFGSEEVITYFVNAFGQVNSNVTEGKGSISFAGSLEGNRITGERLRASFVEQKSGCQIPEQRTAFEGRLEEEGEVMVLTFDAPHYRANWSALFWGLENCLEVSVDNTVRRELRVRRLVTPSTGIEVSPRLSEDGSWIIVGVKPGSFADWMGVLTGDRILALAGMNGKDMSAEAIKAKLQGDEGKTVSVRIARKGWAEPAELTLGYGRVPLPGGKPFGKGGIGGEIVKLLESRQGNAVWRFHIKKIQAGGALALTDAKPGDEIITVDDQDVSQRPLLELIALLRGEPGSKVRIIVRHADGSTGDYTVTRQELTSTAK